MTTQLLAASAVLFVFAQHLAGDSSPDNASWTRLNAGGVQSYRAGDYASAELQFRSALEEAKSFGDADPRYWAALSNLGLALERHGELAAAEPVLRSAAELREHALGAQDPTVQHAWINLATVLHLTHREPEAEPLLRRALAIAETSGDRVLLAEALNSLSLTLLDLGETARAEPVLRRAISIFVQLEGEGSIEAAKAANNLAMVYAAEHDYAKAEAELLDAIPIYEAALGPIHPELIAPLNNMFTILGAQNRFDEGEAYLRRALLIAGHESSEGVRVTQLRSNLGSLEAHRGNYAAAAQIFQGVIAEIERMFGPDDPQLAGPLTGYSSALRHLHQRAEARRAGARASALKNASSFMPR